MDKHIRCMNCIYQTVDIYTNIICELVEITHTMQTNCLPKDASIMHLVFLLISNGFHQFFDHEDETLKVNTKSLIQNNENTLE